MIGAVRLHAPRKALSIRIFNLWGRLRLVVKITGRLSRRSIFESLVQLLAENAGRYFNNMDPEYCFFLGRTKSSPIEFVKKRCMLYVLGPADPWGPFALRDLRTTFFWDATSCGLIRYLLWFLVPRPPYRFSLIRRTSPLKLTQQIGLS
jgi:hypothetical protein